MPYRTAAEIYAELEQGVAAQEELVEASSEHGDHTVAIVATHWLVADEEHVFFGPIVRALRTRAASLGCHVFSCAPGHDHWLDEALVASCVDHGAEAIVVLGGSDGNPDVLSGQWSHLPVVFVEYDPIGPRSAHVGLDNAAAFEQVVTHLIETGRTRIAHITGLLDEVPGAERMAAYRNVLSRMGYPIRPEYIEVGDFYHAAAYESTKRLLALDERPDAIAAACDVQAVAAIKAIEEAGLRCPEDVAVTGFDDAAFAATLTPSLTTVRQPAGAMGAAAFDAAIAMIEDPALAPPTIRLPGELVVRDSSARVSALAKTA